MDKHDRELLVVRKEEATFVELSNVKQKLLIEEEQRRVQLEE